MRLRAETDNGAIHLFRDVFDFQERTGGDIELIYNAIKHEQRYNGYILRGSPKTNT